MIKHATRGEVIKRGNSMKCKMGAENAQFSGGQPKVVADAKHGQYNVICVSLVVGVKNAALLLRLGYY